MRWLCWFNQCRWHYLGAFEQADPYFTPGTQGRRGIYQCTRCKTVSVGAASDPRTRPAEIVNDAMKRLSLHDEAMAAIAAHEARSAR